MAKAKTIDYEIVSEFQGHQKVTGITPVQAAKDLFVKKNEEAMQISVKGEFIEFDTLDELQHKLEAAAENGFSIRVYDELAGG